LTSAAVLAHASGVDTDIAAALAAVRADVDAAAGPVGDDADDDVVGEAEIARRVGGLEPPAFSSLATSVQPSPFAAARARAKAIRR